MNIQVSNEILEYKEQFTDTNSIVRKIWGKSDTILLIFAGASAEFALNKAVDWLYFTGKLPADPMGRLFSTVSYARKIVFSSMDDAHKTIDSLNHIHAAVEQNRGATIQDWAYRDVLYMLIHYSIAAYELLECKMTDAQKEEVYNVFYRLGIRMGLKELPQNYQAWLPNRVSHMEQNLNKSKFTEDLFRQYKRHLGRSRFLVLIESQKLVIPDKVKELLGFNNFSLLVPIVPLYKISRRMKVDQIFKNILIPPEYKDEIKALNME